MSKIGLIKEAKAEFEDIKKYAEEQAVKEIHKRIQPKLQEMINKTIDESVSVQADGASIEITDKTIEVKKDESTVTVNIEDSNESGIDMTDMGAEDIIPTSDNEEADLDSTEEMMFEIALNEEGEATETTEEIQNPFDLIMKKLDDISKKVEGGSSSTPSAEGEVTIVDDEVPTAEMPVAPTPEVAPAPEAPVAPEQPLIQEFNLEENMEEIQNEDELVKEIMKQLEEESSEEVVMDDEMEIELDSEDDSDEMEMEIDLDSEDDSDEMEIELEDDSDDCGCEVTSSDDDSMSIEINLDSEDEDSIEIIDSEDDSDEDTVEEMLGLGLATRRKDTTYVPHVPHKEMNEIKAQYESKLDELIKENNSLKKDLKEFEESFVELRSSIDEMQTFNAKLALANKLFLKGTLSTDDKMKINEALDAASTVKEAEKVYQKLSKDSNGVIKESKISDKIKSKITSSTSSSASGYQSQEVKTLKEGVSRYQQLAGIIKIED